MDLHQANQIDKGRPVKKHIEAIESAIFRKNNDLLAEVGALIITK